MADDEQGSHDRSIERADDTLRDVDLTVERALSFIDEHRRSDYAAAYQWFMDHNGTVGSRLYGKGQRLPGVRDDFAHAAQRGIHKPSGSPYALSVTIKSGEMYDADGSMIKLPDGDWDLIYAAHRNNKGGETDSQWNDSLKNCMRDGLPVGVFVDTGRGYLRSLAFVEEYRPSDETFVLHGPVTPETEHLFRSGVHDYLVGEELVGLDHRPAQELMRDERTAKVVSMKVREGQGRFRRKLMEAYGGACAVTGVETGCTLQAAHILDYRGAPTNVVENGLLLRSDIHALFDDSLLAVDPQTACIVVADSVPDDVYRRLGGHPLRLPKDRSLWPSDEYLGIRFEKFEHLQKMGGA